MSASQTRAHAPTADASNAPPSEAPRTTPLASRAGNLATGAVLQRMCAGCAAGGAPCAECDDEEPTATVERAAASRAGDAPPARVPASVRTVLGAPGAPLPSGTRRTMEARFGSDLGDVRVHTGAQAEASAADVDALAYTVGSHVVFGAGLFAPDTPAGERLLAHELTHALQQRGAAVDPGRLTIGRPDSAAEREAGRAADHGPPARVSSLGVAGLARVPGKKEQPLRFTGSAVDMKWLGGVLKRSVEGLDDKSYETVQGWSTVAVGVGRDPEGNEQWGFTVNRNRSIPKLAESLEKAGFKRWVPTQNAKGRGAVGAPEDAEQLMTAYSFEHDIRLRGMGVTRGQCEDCALETHHYEHGPLKVVELTFPKRKPGAGGKAAGVGGAGPTAGATPPTTKAAPRATPGVTEEVPKDAKGAVTPGKRTSPKKASAPAKKLRGGRTRAPRGTVRRPPRAGGPGGKGGFIDQSLLYGLGEAAMLIVEFVVIAYLRKYFEKGNEEYNEKQWKEGLERLRPGMDAMIEQNTSRILDMQEQGHDVTLRVGIQIRWMTDGTGLEHINEIKQVAMELVTEGTPTRELDIGLGKRIEQAVVDVERYEATWLDFELEGTRADLRRLREIAERLSERGVDQTERSKLQEEGQKLEADLPEDVEAPERYREMWIPPKRPLPPAPTDQETRARLIATKRAEVAGLEKASREPQPAEQRSDVGRRLREARVDLRLLELEDRRGAPFDRERRSEVERILQDIVFYEWKAESGQRLEANEQKTLNTLRTMLDEMTSVPGGGSKD